MALIGNFVIWLDDANPVVGKFIMKSRYFHLWHVAGYALLIAHRTGRCLAFLGPGFFFIRKVARQTFGIVIRCFVLRLFMWVMTSGTAYPAIIDKMTTTIRHSVWLKAYIVDAAPVS